MVVCGGIVSIAPFSHSMLCRLLLPLIPVWIINNIQPIKHTHTHDWEKWSESKRNIFGELPELKILGKYFSIPVTSAWYPPLMAPYRILTKSNFYFKKPFHFCCWLVLSNKCLTILNLVTKHPALNERRRKRIFQFQNYSWIFCFAFFGRICFGVCFVRLFGILNYPFHSFEHSNC